MKKPRSWSALLGRVAFHAVMVLGLWLMLSASASYLELGREHPFFLEKLPLPRPNLWLAALYAHVPSALLSLPACLLLLLAGVRQRWPRFHRWLGRITGVLILCVVVPSGMYLALFAQGGLLSTLGFWLTGVITLVAMIRSVQSARAGRMQAHRRFSVHVAAQLAVAVVSRFALIGAEQFGLYSEWTYIAALWLPVIGCALVAELATRQRRLVLLARGPARLDLLVKGPRHEKLVAVSRHDALR
jgi:uncharacterized membrane protein